MKSTDSKGITLVELIVVIGLMAVLAFAVYPLIKTTYDSWRTVDRRVELLQQGRVGMTKLSDEMRQAYDIYFSTATDFLDYYPDYATTTVYRFNYASSTSEFLEFGTQAPFLSDRLAGPLTNFQYYAYDRQATATAGIHDVNYRQANAFSFRFSVSDERHIAPPTLAPMDFHTFMTMRTSREGYYIGRTNSFASETFYFDQSNSDQMCFKAFCDRTRPDVATATVRISCAIKFLCCPPPCKVGVWYWEYWMNAQTDARGGVDYYYYCLSNAQVDAITTNAAWPPHIAKVSIWNEKTPADGDPDTLDTGYEKCIFYDYVKIVP